jgi:hypothetical protein
LHDIADLESRGIPGVNVATTAFTEAAAAQCKALAFDAAMVFVPHPIQNRTDDEIRAIADATVDAILEKMKTG